MLKQSYCDSLVSLATDYTYEFDWLNVSHNQTKFNVSALDHNNATQLK